MPGYDGKGPRGLGPMTGGGRGYCAVPVESNTRPYAARPFGRGRGRGFRNRYWVTGLPLWQRGPYGDAAYVGANPYVSSPTVDEEKEMLKQEAAALKKELESIQERMSVLEKNQSED